jgi:hypothetical protein
LFRGPVLAVDGSGMEQDKDLLIIKKLIVNVTWINLLKIPLFYDQEARSLSRRGSRSILNAKI